MGFEAVIGLVLSFFFITLTVYNNRKHRQYKERVSDALTRGEVAKEALENLKSDLTTLNELSLIHI